VCSPVIKEMREHGPNARFCGHPQGASHGVLHQIKAKTMPKGLN
jgi:hypothetical protein